MRARSLPHRPRCLRDQRLARQVAHSARRLSLVEPLAMDDDYARTDRMTCAAMVVLGCLVLGCLLVAGMVVLR